ncbi:MAG TPA: sigma factor [Streptosporangiaceae bacterium]|nr:sigma factor [Streptosporangiaceae bacterium]
MDAMADAEFSDFMHGRWSQLVRLGYGLTGDLQLAEDLAQTAFAKAYASWQRVRRVDNPDAYLRRVVIVSPDIKDVVLQIANGSRLRMAAIAIGGTRVVGYAIAASPRVVHTLGYGVSGRPLSTASGAGWGC